MEENTSPHGATIPSSSGPQRIPAPEGAALLVHKKLSAGDEAELSGMGIQGGANVLAHQRNHLQRQTAKRLAPKNGNVQKMRSASIGVYPDRLTQQFHFQSR
jgi:hypothetical protein